MAAPQPGASHPSGRNSSDAASGSAGSRGTLSANGAGISARRGREDISIDVKDTVPRLANSSSTGRVAVAGMGGGPSPAVDRPLLSRSVTADGASSESESTTHTHGLALSTLGGLATPTPPPLSASATSTSGASPLRTPVSSTVVSTASAPATSDTAGAPSIDADAEFARRLATSHDGGHPNHNHNVLLDDLSAYGLDDLAADSPAHRRRGGNNNGADAAQSCCCSCLYDRQPSGCGGCTCWTRLPFDLRVLVLQTAVLGVALLCVTLSFVFQQLALAVVSLVVAAGTALSMVAVRVMRARSRSRRLARQQQRYVAVSQGAGGAVADAGAAGGAGGAVVGAAAVDMADAGRQYRAGGLHPLATRHLQAQDIELGALARGGRAGGGGLYADLLAQTLAQNAYALDPQTLAQLALVNPRLVRQLSGGNNSTHLRLSMMDRDFTANDYETLCSLDEEARAGQITGIPQSQIERMPVITVPAAPPAPLPPPPSSTAPVAAAAGASAAAAADASTASPVRPVLSPTAAAHKCAVCLEPTQPGEKLRVLLCTHRFHVECVDKWLRRKAACPTCLYDHKNM